jgi:hypothetical protein
MVAPPKHVHGGGFSTALSGEAFVASWGLGGVEAYWGDDVGYTVCGHPDLPAFATVDEVVVVGAE